jgi:hypothetical protein
MFSAAVRLSMLPVGCIILRLQIRLDLLVHFILAGWDRAMASAQVACPQCQSLLRSAVPLPAGAKVQCGKCGLKFFVGAAVPPVAPPDAVTPGMPAASAGPADPPFFAPPRPTEKRSVWVYFLPVALGILVLAGVGLLVVILLDANSSSEPRKDPSARNTPSEEKKADKKRISEKVPENEERAQVRVDDGPAVEEVPVDPEPRIRLQFLHPSRETNKGMSFGLVMVKEKDARGANKKLTYREDGWTNNTVLRIDSVTECGFGSVRTGEWIERKADLGTDPKGRRREGARSLWRSNTAKIQVTQVAEIVPSIQAVDVGPDRQARLLDTCLVRYKIENKDDRAHRVGIRFLLDTFIGSNDGVPFTVGQELCSTMKELQGDRVPDFIQALEYANLQNPGTIAQVTLRMAGGLEAPERVLLTRWPGTVDGWYGWNVPLAPMRDDSAVVLYWKEQSLEPGASRVVGFAYGLGTIASAEGTGKLGVTLGGSFEPRGIFTVTAYVTNPVRGQTLTLTLPDGLTRVGGEATQPVPPLPADAASNNSVVTWKVRVERLGRFTLKVKSSTGLAQTKTITITKSAKLGADL